MSGYSPNPIYADPENVNTNMVGVHYGNLNKMLGIWNGLMDNSLTLKLMHGFNSSPSLEDVAAESVKKGRRLTKDEVHEVLFPKPADEEALNEARVKRPGIEIPDGTSVDTLKAITNRYDDKVWWDESAQQPSGTIATLAGYGLEIVGGIVTDPIGAEGAGKIASIANYAYRPAAAKWLETLGTKSFAGVGAAKVATKVSQSSVTGGAGFAGFTALQETGLDIESASRGEDVDFGQSFLNIGQSAGIGLGLGTAFGFAGVGLESQHFQNVSARTKKVAGDKFRYWTGDAGAQARTDATAQMVDGKPPEVGGILNMGQIEEGVKFRERLKENGVDLPQFSEELTESKQSISEEINTLNKKNPLEEPVTEFAAEAVQALEENPEIVYEPRQLLDRFRNVMKLTMDEAENLYQSIKEFIPERASSERGRRVSEGHIYADLKKTGESSAPPTKNIQRILKMERHIKELQEIAENPDTHPTARKKALDYARRLQEKIPDLNSASDEIAAIMQKIMPDGVAIKGFRRTPEYKRLQELAPGSHIARNALVKAHLSSPNLVKQLAKNMRNARINDLYDQWHMADTMQKHVDGTHEPVTQADRKVYFDHLKSSGLEKIDFRMPDADAKIDEVLVKFDESYVKSLADIVENPDIARDYNALKELLGTQSKYKTMAKTLTDCIMKGLGA